MREAVNAALQAWINWLIKMHLTSPGGATHEPGRAIRGNTEYADRILSGLLLSERMGHDYPASLHQIILDLPQPQPHILAQLALGDGQATIANRMGMSQPTISRIYQRAELALHTRMVRNPCIVKGVNRELGTSVLRLVAA
jgi:hypothetical protein